MLLFSYYIEDKVDKAWFDSSNVYYAECDESDTAEKTVRVVFKNGQQYKYNNVNVYDWALFKNSESQGKALNSIFKKNGYSYEKIDNADLEALDEEYVFRSGNGITINVDGNKIVSIQDNKDNILYESGEDGYQSIPDMIKDILGQLGYKTKIKSIHNGKSE